MEEESFQIEWRIDVEENSIPDPDDVRDELKSNHGDSINRTEIRRPLAATGVVTALSITASVTTITVGVVEIIKYLSEEDHTAEIIIIAPSNKDIDPEELTSIDSRIEVLQRQD